MSQTQEHAAPFRAQTIELFFDLVFVFTITQITHLVGHAHDTRDYLQALSVLILIWWMYGGYIWLTNHAHTPKAMRLVLVLAMIGFLVMALAIPQEGRHGRLVFGIAYLGIVVLHYLAFVWQGGAQAARAMLRILPFNLAGAGLVIASGLTDAEWAWMLLAAPALLFAAVSLTNHGEGYRLDAGHFVERHGLLLIIVLGEIVIAVGTAFPGPPENLAGLMLLILSVMLVAALWWSYFDRDDQAGEHSMLAADNRTRTRMALLGYNGGHLFMIAGLILVAAGLRMAIAEGTPGHAAASAPTAAALLLTGLSLYLAADAVFRTLCGLRPVLPRAFASVVCIGLALALPALHGLLVPGTGLAVLGLMLLLEDARLPLRS